MMSNGHNDNLICYIHKLIVVETYVLVEQFSKEEKEKKKKIDDY